MGRIKIEDIQQILAEDGWNLLSEEYKNLDSLLKFECNSGHVIVAPWKKIREKRICPICLKETAKIKTINTIKVSRIITILETFYILVKIY